MICKADKNMAVIKQTCTHPSCQYEVLNVKRTNDKLRYSRCPQCGSPLLQVF